MKDNQTAPTWRAIDGWPEYEVSDQGQIRRTRIVAGARGIYLKGWTNPITGYRQVGLTRNGKTTCYLISRLVATAFLGPPPPSTEAAHWDRDPQNNHLSNLRWATPSENQHDKYRHGTDRQGIKSPSAKLTEEQVKEIRRRAAAGEPYHAIAAAYGVARSVPYNIHHRRTWKHLP